MEPSNYKKPISKKKKKVSITSIIGGDILKEDFVVKQSKLLIMIAFLFILFIGNRYSCLKKITQIEDLKRELNDVKYESLVLSTQITSGSRQSQIESLIESKGIELQISKTPPFEIEK